MRLRLLLTMLALPVVPAMGADLGGSRASMRHQHEIAVENDFTFLRTAAQIREYVAKERLVEVVSNDDLIVHKVSFPYTRPILKLFIERFAAQFHRATGERLVVTSLTRPTSRQPRNASPLSVHPAGMAMDFRIPKNAMQRKWIEATLLELEHSGVLDVTRERRPPHYHVAVFPEAYQAYVDKLIPREIARAATLVYETAATAVQAVADATAPAPSPSQGIPAPMLATLIAAAMLATTAGGLTLKHARK